MGRFIILDKDNIVTGIRIGKNMVSGEIQSDMGELGQAMQVDGTFIASAKIPEVPEETQLDRIEKKLDELLKR